MAMQLRFFPKCSVIVRRVEYPRRSPDVFRAAWNTHTVPKATSRNGGQSSALGLTILSSRLRSGSTSPHFCPAFESQFHPVVSPWVAPRKGKPPPRSAGQPRSPFRGCALGESAQCLAVCCSAVGDLSLRRSVLCCGVCVCGGHRRHLAVSPEPPPQTSRV